MSFDGVTKDANPWYPQNVKAIANLKKVNLKCVLVPVLIGGKNLDQAGKIVKFALDNMDIIRGVNFQPISFCGRVTKIKDEKRDQQRVDYVMMMEAIEKDFALMREKALREGTITRKITINESTEKKDVEFSA